MAHLQIIKSGMLSLLQDSGRVGYSKLGVTSAGVADEHAYYWLNRLLHNESNATCVEIALGGMALEVLDDCVFCVTGADVPITVNGTAFNTWQTHSVKKDDIIELGFAKNGVRAYFGLAGGIAAEKQLGSASAVLREKLGGLSRTMPEESLALQSGDVLTVAADNEMDFHAMLLPQFIPIYHKHMQVRVIPSYQQTWFERDVQRDFYSSSYQVSKQWDRMGVRMEGKEVKASQGGLLSEGIALGAIQVPPDGQPIILMQDRQTLGGYPKIATVISADLPLVAQSGQGTKLHFHPISIEQAHNALHFEHFKRKQTQLTYLGKVPR